MREEKKKFWKYTITVFVIDLLCILSNITLKIAKVQYEPWIKNATTIPIAIAAVGIIFLGLELFPFAHEIDLTEKSNNKLMANIVLILCVYIFSIFSYGALISCVVPTSFVDILNHFYTIDDRNEYPVIINLIQYITAIILNTVIIGYVLNLNQSYMDNIVKKKKIEITKEINIETIPVSCERKEKDNNEVLNEIAECKNILCTIQNQSDQLLKNEKSSFQEIGEKVDLLQQKTEEILNQKTETKEVTEKLDDAESNELVSTDNMQEKKFMYDEVPAYCTKMKDIAERISMISMNGKIQLAHLNNNENARSLDIIMQEMLKVQEQIISTTQELEEKSKIIYHDDRQ